MADKKYDVDLIVIGGGSGGMAAAKEAKKLNKKSKVVLFDYVKPSPAGTKWKLGGTCVNVGCIPKKLMHFSGLLGHSFEAAKEMGWKLEEKQIHEWTVMAPTIQDYISSLNWSYKRQLKSAGVRYINEYATLVDPHTVQYEEKGKVHRISANNIIIATGGRPNYGDFPGKELCISSDDIFWLKKSPGKTLVIGAGYIALECAGFLHEIGLDTTVMVRSQVMRKFDAQVGAQVGELMERNGIRFLLPANAVSFKKPKDSIPTPPEGSVVIGEGARKGQIQFPAKGGVSRYQHPSGAVEVVDGKGEVKWEVPPGPIEVEYKFFNGDEKVHTERFDTVLLAIARNANIANIGLEQVGVKTMFGKILVDQFERTTVPNIFAVGDVSIGVSKHGFEVGSPVQVKRARDLLRGVVTVAIDGKYAVRLTEGKDRGVVVAGLSADALIHQTKDRPELTPVAIKAGAALAKRLHTNEFKEPFRYDWIPTTVFTSPEYGYCGLSTEEAELDPEEGGIGRENVEVWYSRYGPIEQTPLHPHYIEPKSRTMLGRNLWAKRYAEKHNLLWPGDAAFDEADYNHVYYDDGKQLLKADVTAPAYEQDGKWVYDIKLVDGEGSEIKGVSPDKLDLRDDSAKFRAERYIKSNHLAKLVVDKRNDRVVGFHFVGNGAGEVTQGFALALSVGVTKAHFDQMVGIHPTAAEEFAVLDVSRSSGQSFLKQEGCGGGSC